MKITEKDVLYVTALANLELQQDEVSRFAADLDSILAYIDKLNELDTSGVEPMAQVLYGQSEKAAAKPDNGDSTLRPDLAVPWFSQEQAVGNAPEKGAGQFKVPKVIER